MPTVNYILDRIRKKLIFPLRCLRLRFCVKHISGPQSISLDHDEVVLLCMFKNGALYLNSFLAHYDQLGVAHYVFMDTGSDDESLAMLKENPRVTVLQTTVHYGFYHVPIIRYLQRRFAWKKWSLQADIDELFDYPHSDKLPLPQLIEYLDRNQYDALPAYMLERFADAKLETLESSPNDSLSEKYPLYDLAHIEKVPYASSMRWPRCFISNPDIMEYQGGIRSALFNDTTQLTKHPLQKSAYRIQPFIHFIRGARIADITGVLYHYRFLGNLRASAEQFAQGGRPDERVRYNAILSQLEKEGDINPCLETAQPWISTNHLMEQTFLTVSPNYLKSVEAQSLHNPR